MTTLPEAPAFLAKAATPPPCTSQPCLFHDADAEATAKAVDLCHDCPLMLACRSWARTNREHGVAGGETEEDRTAAGYGPVALADPDHKGCGTESGAQFHRRHGEIVCEACVAAESEAHRLRREALAAKRADMWPPHLTPRELAVLEALAAGLSRSDITRRLGIGRKSTDAYFHKLRKKLKADNAGLVPTAREAGLLPAVEYGVAA